MLSNLSEKYRYHGEGLPYLDISGLKGKIIALEGTDGVGRSTQLRLLREWLEVQGFGVVDTGWTRSRLMAKTIMLAKEGHQLNRLTYTLLYATDFADRLENEIIPALRSGFIVLADRYIYTVFARAKVRGVDSQWVRRLFGFALRPDLTLYLKIDINTLTRRVLESRGMDYWESGMDQYPGLDPYESFRKYQSQLIREFNSLAREFNFVTLDARKSIQRIQTELRRSIEPLLMFTHEAHEAHETVPEPAGQNP